MTFDDKHPLSRRNLLKIGGTGIALTAGCVSQTDDSETTTQSDSGSGDNDESTTEQTTAEETGPYTIGMVNSLTGSLSAFGERNKRGKQLALEDVNAAGIGGRDLEIIEEDSQSESQGGVSAAQKLVNQDSVPFVIGSVGSGVSLAIYQSVIEGTDVVQLSQNSTSPGLSEFPGLLRMSPTGLTQSKALAKMIKEDGFDSVAITWINNDYGQGITDAFVDVWDGDIAYNNSHDQGQSSYSNVVGEMANADADAWLFITYQPEFSTMAQEAYSNGYDASFYGADSVKGPKVIDNAPEGSLDGMKVVAPSAAVDQDNYKQFASTFEAEFGDAPTAWSAYAYDCVVTAALAIATSDDFTPKGLQETVREVTRPTGQKVFTAQEAMDVLGDGGSAADINYEGVSGPIDLDENGDPAGYLQIFEVVDHDYTSTGFIAG